MAVFLELIKLKNTAPELLWHFGGAHKTWSRGFNYCFKSDIQLG